MKIARIKLTNFGRFEDAEVTFDQPLSIIRGCNKQGKTTIANAAKLALSKSCETTDPRGAGAADYINVNAKKAEIELGIDGKAGALELRVSYGPGKVGRQQQIIGGGPDVAELFAGFMDRNQERLSCVLDSDYFLSPKVDQKAILAALVLPSSYEWDPDTMALVERHLGRQDWQGNPAALIDWIYGDDRRGAYGERKTAKIVLNSIAVPPTPQKPEYTEQAEIQTKLFELRKKASTEANKLRKTTAGQVPRAELVLKNQQDALAHEEAALRQAEVTYAEHDKKLLTGTTLKKHEKVAAGRVTFADLQKQIDACGKRVEEAITAQDIYREMLADPFCPTCTQPISKPFVDGKVVEFQAVVLENRQRQEDLIRQQGALGDIAAAEKAIGAHNAALAERDVAAGRIKAHEQAIPVLRQAVTAAEAALDTARAEDAVPQDTSAYDALTAEISECESKLGPAINYANTLKHIDDAKAKRSAQQAKVNDLERICATFGKDGIRATLIDEHQAAFTESINFALAFWGYECRLEMEPYSFEVRVEDGWLPIKQLSGAERLFFKMALQAAIAIQSGLRLMVVDKFDTMIEEERGKALDCVAALLEADMLDQVIILVADGRTEAPKVDGVGFYLVADRQVTRLS